MIIHSLPTLNEYINIERGSKYAAAKIKKKWTESVAWEAKTQTLETDQLPALFTFRWVERNKRRDPDNIAFAKKFIFDGMVMAGVLPNDGWSVVGGMRDLFICVPEINRSYVEITACALDSRKQ